jgi:RND superfamily putative drug exporter
VIAISFILLTTAFRSVVIPAKAAVLNILSIGAAYGVIVAIFQWGWGASLIGLHSTLPIPAYVPMLVFCIVFGLSMDYEVFLLSRIHEAWIATRDAKRSVAIGIGATAKVITTAAAIMIAVFTSFVLDTDPTVKMLAVGMAFAVLIDASLVRMVLVPSVMTMLGSTAWWMPRWLEPIVPRLQPEGSTASAAGDGGEPASPDEQESGTGQPAPSWDGPGNSVPRPRRRKDEEVKASAPHGHPHVPRRRRPNKRPVSARQVITADPGPSRPHR